MTDQLLPIVREAGEMMRRADHPGIHQKPGHFNYVTETDVAIETFLQERLRALLPGSLFIGEESAGGALTDAPTWIVDPIDGTLNFMRQRGWSAVSVCLLRDKVPAVACVLNPYGDELFHAVRGEGAFCNDVPIHVSNLPLDQALVGLGTSPYNAELAEATAQAARLFLQEAGDLRRMGAAALDLADVACGRLEVMFEMRLSPWDVAAGALLVTEAGGVFDMPWQDRVAFDAPACTLASNPGCHARAKEILLATRPKV